MSYPDGCPSCDRDLSYPGAPGHACYTYAEQAARIRASELGQLRAAHPPSLPCPKPFSRGRAPRRSDYVILGFDGSADAEVPALAALKGDHRIIHAPEPCSIFPIVPAHLWDGAVVGTAIADQDPTVFGDQG